MPSPTLDAIFGMERKLVVGVGGMAVSNNQSAVLTTYSLGSCIGVTIYDPVAKAGGMLHAMLPDSSINDAKAAEQPAMFVDTGVPALFRAAYQLHAEKHRVQICVAGGAQFLDKNAFFNIGQRNYERFIALMAEHRLVLRAQAAGGLVSRTIELSIKTGQVRLKTSGQTGETILLEGNA